MRGESGMKIIINTAIIFVIIIIYVLVLDIGIDRECSRIDCEIEHWERQGYPILGE